MSLDRTADCPLFAQDDIVRLHSSIRCVGTTLTDKATATEHVFHRSAQPTLTTLSHGTTVAQLYRAGTIQPVHVTEILGLCNVIGALEIDRSMSSSIGLSIKRWRSFLFGIVYTSSARRYKANLSGICIATFRACQLLSIASLAVGVLVAVTMQRELSTIVSSYLWCLCIFIGSIIVHEYGHVYMLGRNNIAAVVLQRKNTIVLLHAKAENETWIALAGPLAGCVFLAVCWLAFSSLHIAYATQIVVCIALAHCLSLTPFYADGKSLPYYQRLLRWRSS